MKRFFLSFILAGVSVCLVASAAFAECRLWAAVARRIPAEVTTYSLLKAPNSLKALSCEHTDGWAIGFYEDNQPVVERGSLAANVDSAYDAAAERAAALRPGIVLAHIRTAVSGCLTGDNPHPFVRTAGEKTWLFAHNGTINKAQLIRFIGDEYLAQNPPVACADNPPESWVDSELYFIFILKMIEHNGGNVEAGIRQAVQALEEVPSKTRGLNFVLSDGETLWAFRGGRSLYYYYYPEHAYRMVASMYTGSQQGIWNEVPEGALVVMTQQGAPAVVGILAEPQAKKKTSGSKKKR